MSTNNKLINIAINKNAGQGHGHTAICSMKNKVICHGTNHDNRTSYNGSLMYSVHAEVDALMNLLRITKMEQYNVNKMRRKFKKVKICVIQVSDSTSTSSSCIKNSFPCINCMWYLKEPWYKKNKVFERQWRNRIVKVSSV